MPDIAQSDPVARREAQTEFDPSSTISTNVPLGPIAQSSPPCR